MKNYKFNIHGTKYEVQINSVENGIINLELNGTSYDVNIDKDIKQMKTPTLVRKAPVLPSEIDSRKMATNPVGSILKSPLPGTVLEICVKEGDKVEHGQKVMILEAMKMENNIESDVAGIVRQVKVSNGSSVMEGDVLLVIE